ncbi:MAG: TonB-dependent receptor [Acidobacteria bacterium]|nr:TonB-dependent receptor [Acidobacteriota bacterium]
MYAPFSRVWHVCALIVWFLGPWERGLDAQAPAAPEQPAQRQSAPTVEETVVVVGATPLAGIGIDRDLIPSNVQSISSDGMIRPGGMSTADQLRWSAASVHVNEATTNAFQPDLQFRGFTASPLLGLPQGLAVYQNGVRLNEPFGDTVNWDLLPGAAVAGIDLMPGSNPLFGLNALGGAVSVRTKTGFSHPGHAVTVSSGSFGRHLVEGASGGHRERLSYFVAGSALAEDGWRDFSPSRVRQVFGDVAYRGAATTINASLTSGHNRLIGNGAAPIELLEEQRTAIFTHPDETKTRMTLLTLTARHQRSPSVSFDGSLFFRRAGIDTFNGDDSDYDECENETFEGILCTDEGDGDPVESVAGGLIAADEDDELNGTNNTSNTLTNGWGGTAQASVVTPLKGRQNHFVAGVTFDGGRSRYGADTEIARLTEDRGTAGIGLFDEDARVRLRTRVRHTGLYAANFFSVAPAVTIMGAARFNYSTVQLRDQIGTDLDGDHTFSRLNPSVGATWTLSSGPTVFGSFSMSSRVPAPSELSCADPEDPCRLPNAFVADPPLDQVVASTWEAGVRSSARGVSWNLSAFRTANRDDIMFISSGPFTSSGHFENVGDTLRRGLEAGARGGARGIEWAASYSWLRATFGSPLTLSSPNHPDEVDGEIEVAEGSRIPGVPQHNLKASVSAAIRRATLGAVVLVSGRQYLRGDEANLLPAVAGFTLVNLNASYALAPSVRLAARVTNLLGSDFATFGLLGEADEVLGDDYEDPRFLSPGAPRAAWIGLEFSFR